MLALNAGLTFRRSGFALGVLALATVAAAQGPPAGGPPAGVTVKPVKDNVYFASGSTGSNNGIIVTPQGVIVVDTGVNTDAEKLELAEIAKLTPKPITTAIITHSDGDHVTGLAVLPPGITIISQENCKKEMEAAASAPPPQGRAPATPASAIPLPTKTVASKDSTAIDGVQFQFLHVANAHTSGDLMIYLPAQKIVFTGDIISGDTPYPLIHLEKNGSSQGWIETVTAVLAWDADTYVPGHGNLHTKAEIQQRLDAVKQRRAQIADLVKQGKSLDDIKQQLGETAPAPAAGGRGPRFPSFTEIVYQELTKKN